MSLPKPVRAASLTKAKIAQKQSRVKKLQTESEAYRNLLTVQLVAIAEYMVRMQLTEVPIVVTPLRSKYFMARIPVPNGNQDLNACTEHVLSTCGQTEELALQKLKQHGTYLSILEAVGKIQWVLISKSQK